MERALKAAIAAGSASELESALKNASADKSVDASVLREAVLKLAKLEMSRGAAASAPATAEGPSSKPTGASKETSLRDWLSKSLDCRILDRTLEALEREDVFFVADLAEFCALPRFTECLTALTRERVLNALKDEGLISSTAPVPPSPLGPDDSTPDWLAEAECIVFEKPETPPPESPMLMKFEDFPPTETAREGDLLGLSPGDMLSKSSWAATLTAMGPATASPSAGPVPAAARGLRAPQVKVEANMKPRASTLAGSHGLLASPPAAIFSDLTAAPLVQERAAAGLPPQPRFDESRGREDEMLAI